MNNIHATELGDADTHAPLDSCLLCVQMKQEKVSAIFMSVPCINDD